MTMALKPPQPSQQASTIHWHTIKQDHSHLIRYLPFTGIRSNRTTAISSDIYHSLAYDQTGPQPSHQISTIHWHTIKQDHSHLSRHLPFTGIRSNRTTAISAGIYHSLAYDQTGPQPSHQISTIHWHTIKQDHSHLSRHLPFTGIRKHSTSAISAGV